MRFRSFAPLMAAGLIAAASASSLAAPMLSAEAPSHAVLKSSPGGDFQGALLAPGGRIIGHIALMEGPRGVLLSVKVEGLAPGWHGMHFHEKGDCGDAAFKNSGGHMNHDPKLTHGLLAAGGPDFGDLPNLWVGADGTGQAQAFSTAVTMRSVHGRANLLDADGSALVIHAMPDDQVTQPIGGAGARVACSVIGPTGLIKAG